MGTTALAYEVEIHANTQKLNGNAEEMAFISGAEGDRVRPAVSGAGLASGVDGLGHRYAWREVLAHNDVVAGRGLKGLTVKLASAW